MIKIKKYFIRGEGFMPRGLPRLSGIKPESNTSRERHTAGLLILFLFPLFVFSCVSSAPRLGIYTLLTDEVEGRLFFFPPTRWETQKGVKLDIDINFRDTPLMPTIIRVGISLKEQPPGKISSIVFQGDGAAFSLSEIKGLEVRRDKKFLRVTGILSYEEFIQLIKSEQITMTVTVDGTSYTSIPSKEFLAIQLEFNALMQ
jgi:hypothetical protein